MIAYYIVKFFSWLMCILPKWCRDLTASFLGNIALLATPKWRLQMAAGNIKECLGLDDARANEIAEQSVKRFGRMIVEVMRFPVLNKDNMNNSLKIEGLEYLDAAYKQHKGVIIATAHYGNWELLGAAIALKGYPLLSITRKQNNKYMDKFINEYREMVGQKVTYNRGENGILAISRMLKNKNLLGVLYDQDTNDDGIKTDLFGKKLITPSGAAVLSRLYGSPIIPSFIHNNDDGTCTVKFYPPLYTTKTENKTDDYIKVTKELMIILEHEIIRHPDMWFWVHDRWKDGRERFAIKK